MKGGQPHKIGFAERNIYPKRVKPGGKQPRGASKKKNRRGGGKGEISTACQLWGGK